ncbi:Hsp33 family molecular chaperone HslO [Paracoccus sp. (in: a-proteobacteria)]|uniref:Hsp33 family molecular chaperone HslO n=1 Tax=Paracoccus sp. TaxID=267 RepID=UPI002AFFBEFE|nr:Hsp33 family molecular chaperone HslO [Paracoccus sp. (in: a-proteobacteria)]
MALDGHSLEDVAHDYFLQSEQIPTQVRLAVAEFTRKGDHRPHRWRAGGVLIQHLPEHGMSHMADLPGDGDGEPEAADHIEHDDDWTEARAMLATVDDLELADPDLGPERLLFRLYHETGVRVFQPLPMVDALHLLQADRIEAMLATSFTPGPGRNGCRWRNRSGVRILLRCLSLQPPSIRRRDLIRSGYYFISVASVAAVFSRWRNQNTHRLAKGKIIHYPT